MLLLGAAEAPLDLFPGAGFPGHVVSRAELPTVSAVPPHLSTATTQGFSDRTHAQGRQGQAAGAEPHGKVRPSLLHCSAQRGRGFQL